MGVSEQCLGRYEWAYADAGGTDDVRHGIHDWNGEPGTSQRTTNAAAGESAGRARVDGRTSWRAAAGEGGI
jgi:hypothetical protein